MKLFGVFLIAGLLAYISPDGGNHSIERYMASGTMSEDTTSKPTVILEKVILQPMAILFISDTAEDMAGLGKVFATDYSELFRFVNLNELMVANVMAFYPSYSLKS